MTKPGIVHCSNCGSEFSIPGQVHGFSHCDQHDAHKPTEVLVEWVR